MNADTTSGQADPSTPDPYPENVVALGDQIVHEVTQTKSAEELERRRAVTVRALQIAGKQLETDAQRFLEQMVVGEVPPKRRLELAEQSKCLFVAAAWLEAITSPQPETPPSNGAANA